MSSDQPDRTRRLAVPRLPLTVTGAALLMVLSVVQAAPAPAAPAQSSPARGSAPHAAAHTAAHSNAPTTQGVDPDIDTLSVPAVAAGSPSAAPGAVTPQDRQDKDLRAQDPDLRVVAQLPAQRTQGYKMLGVTWQLGTAGDDVRVEVRTLGSDGWSDWSELKIDPGHGPSAQEAAAASVRGGTSPAWVGQASGVQVRVLNTSAQAPAGIQVDLIDPGTLAMAGSPAGTVTPYRTTWLMPIPTIISRRQWGADPSLTDKCWPPRYAKTLKAVFIHHTAGATHYPKSESDDIVRGIYAYHTQGRGWCDIGYNFLIDRYGQIFEGRRGGVRKPVRGAHAGSVNLGSTGIALMGNFQTGWPTKAMKHALVRLVTWELESHYLDPHGHTHLAGNRYSIISGHRDAMSTLCPGDHVYNWLPTLRNRVENQIASWRSAIYRKWQSEGGGSGWLGYPFKGEQRRPDHGRRTVFNHGYVFSNPKVGAHPVHGPILRSFKREHGVYGPLGYPRWDENGSAGGNSHARKQGFQHGRIYYLKGPGPHAIWGPILNAYDRNGGAAGVLGFPIRDLRGSAGGNKSAQKQAFQDGRIYYLRGPGAHEIHGPILNRYDRLNGAAGRLGFPTSDVHGVRGGLRSNFQHGWIRWDRSSGKTTVHYN